MVFDLTLPVGVESFVGASFGGTPSLMRAGLLGSEALGVVGREFGGEIFTEMVGEGLRGGEAGGFLAGFLAPLLSWRATFPAGLSTGLLLISVVMSAC